MAFMDKLKNAKELVSGFAGKVGEVAKTSISQAQTAVNEKMEKAKQKKLSQQGGLKRYAVTYKGGYPDFVLEKKKSPYIVMDIMPDRFSFLPEPQSENWFTGFEIPYSKVVSLEIVERTISTTESFLAGGSDNSDLRQKNVIEITYIGEDNDEYVVRNEMLTGTTVMGQAKVCQEMMDFLRINKILKMFAGASGQVVENKSNGAEEFVNKKKELLLKL